MRDFGVVFQFEFLQQIKKRAMIVSTIILCVAAMVLAALPALTSRFGGLSDFEMSEGASYLNDSIPGGYYVEDSKLAKELNLDESKLYQSEDDLKQAVQDGDESVGYVIYNFSHYKTYYHDKGLFDGMNTSLSEVLKEHQIAQSLSKMGVSEQEYQALQNEQIQVDEEVLGRNSATQYGLAFVYVLVLYIVILLSGSVVAVAVAREKDSRTMELLITTTDPKNLIIGKVLAVTTACFLQIAVIGLFGFLSFLVFRSGYPTQILFALKLMMDFSLIGMYVLYFVLGLLLYMFIFAALGSVVSRIEDVNSAISPIMILFVLSYIIAMSTLQNGDTIITKVASWIPFFSVMVMPIRFALTSVALYEVIGSTVLTIVFIYLFARLSIRIYRWGTLNYGNKPNFFKVCKEVLFSKQ